MIGARLANVRRYYGDSQQQLANKVHVSIHTVSSWEQGKSNPSHNDLVAICQLYGVSSDYLLGLTNDDPIFTGKRRTERFTPEERAEIKVFEEYLLYKRKK